jgi:hypothetical protein
MTRKDVNERIKSIEKKLHFCAPQDVFEKEFKRQGIISDYRETEKNTARKVTAEIAHNHGYRTCSFLDTGGNIIRYYVHKSVVLSPEQIDEMALVNKVYGKGHVGSHNRLDDTSSKVTGRSPKRLFIIEGQAI